jgi:hypothetical protein
MQFAGVGCKPRAVRRDSRSNDVQWLNLREKSAAMVHCTFPDLLLLRVELRLQWTRGGLKRRGHGARLRQVGKAVESCEMQEGPRKNEGCAGFLGRPPLKLGADRGGLGNEVKRQP